MGKKAAKGAVLQVKNGTWQPIPYLGDIGFNPFDVDRMDGTTQDSPNNTEEKIPGIRKAAKLSYPIKWDDTNPVHAFLLASNGTIQSFRYIGAGAVSAYGFNAIMEVQWENPVKGLQGATLDLELSDGNTPS